MGKRFGRNQKRRLKAELEAARFATSMDRELLRHQGDQIRLMKASLDNVRKVLGEHFAALPPQRKRVQDLVERIYVSNLSGSINYPCLVDERLTKDLCRETDMAVNAVKAFWLELQADNLSHQVFLNLDTPGGAIGYAVSETAILKTPPHILAEHATNGMRETLTELFAARCR